MGWMPGRVGLLWGAKSPLTEDQQTLLIPLRPNTEAAILKGDFLALGSMPEGQVSGGALDRGERAGR